MKLASFHPKALDVIKEFPKDVRRELGKVIFDLQKGVKLTMPTSRAMSSVAAGVSELRLRVSVIKDAINTSSVAHEVALAQERLKELRDEKS